MSQVPPDPNHPPLPVAHLRKPNKRRLLIFALVVVIAAGFAVFDGISSRAANDRTLESWSNAQAVPTVALVLPEPNKGTQDLTLPGTIQAFYSAPIYARVSGYVKNWNADIGTKVKKGQELAEIDSPDLDQQALQSQANLAGAVVADKLSSLTSSRWQALLGWQTVSRQDADNKLEDAQAKQAAVLGAQANVRQLAALQGFKHIVAPFDGVITARSTDIGALVNAGSAAGAPLFQVSDIHIARIYVQMPQAYAAALTAGLKASLSVPQTPDQLFEATVTGTSNSFSEASRTVSVQLQRDNSDGKLWPGSYTEVTFHVPADPNILRVPATALVFGAKGMQIATLGPDEKILFKSVKLGRDLGNNAEVVSGLLPTDRVVLSPPEWLNDGDIAKPATLPPAATVASAKNPE